jgi:hypothetical protein
LSIIRIQSISNKLIEIAVIAAVLVVFLIAMQFAYGESICDNQTNQTTGYNQTVETLAQQKLDKFNLDTDLDIGYRQLLKEQLQNNLKDVGIEVPEVLK